MNPNHCLKGAHLAFFIQILNVSGGTIEDFTRRWSVSRQKRVCHQSNVPPQKLCAPNHGCHGCKIKEPGQVALEVGRVVASVEDAPSLLHVVRQI